MARTARVISACSRRSSPGLAGPELTAREAAVLREARPCGVILFARNAVDPDQLRRLTEAAQRRGRRGDPRPHRPGGRARAAAAAAPLAGAAGGRGLCQGAMPAICSGRLRAARAAARLTAADLRAVGINTNCAPLLDVPAPGSHGVIGDRAYAATRGRCGGVGRGGGGRADGRRRAARHQAYPRARPRHRRQPFRPARRDGDAGGAGGHRFRAVPRACRPARGHDGARRVHGLSMPTRRPASPGA